MAGKVLKKTVRTEGLFCANYLVTIQPNQGGLLDNTNSPEEQNTAPQLAKENSISGDGSSPTLEKSSLEEHIDERAIDLNKLFPDSEMDLNDLFPDTEVKHLLKKIIKNKKDMNLIKERLVTENKTPEEGEENAKVG